MVVHKEKQRAVQSEKARPLIPGGGGGLLEEGVLSKM
jgi:hypothetical protein